MASYVCTSTCCFAGSGLLGIVDNGAVLVKLELRIHNNLDIGRQESPGTLIVQSLRMAGQARCEPCSSCELAAFEIQRQVTGNTVNTATAGVVLEFGG